MSKPALVGGSNKAIIRIYNFGLGPIDNSVAEEVIHMLPGEHLMKVQFTNTGRIFAVTGQEVPGDSK